MAPSPNTCRYRVQGEPCGHPVHTVARVGTPGVGLTKIPLCRLHQDASDDYLEILARWPMDPSETEPFDRSYIRVGSLVVNKITRRIEIIRFVGRRREARLESGDGYHHVIRKNDLINLYEKPKQH